jgi:hypothetical protein
MVGAAMQDELDKNLQSLFHERTQSLPEEPFIGNLLKRIQRRRFRKVILQSLLLVLGLACCVALSPLLIKGSIMLSNALNAIFGHAGAFMATRTGMITSACVALLLFVLKPKRFFRFV